MILDAALNLKHIHLTGPCSDSLVPITKIGCCPGIKPGTVWVIVVSGVNFPQYLVTITTVPCSSVLSAQLNSNQFGVGIESTVRYWQWGRILQIFCAILDL